MTATEYRPSASSAQRSEVQLAAQVLARLLRHGVIPLGMREEAQRVVGLQTFEVTAALNAPRWEWTPPRRVDVPAHEQHTSVTKLRPAPQHPEFRNTRKRKADAEGNLYCTGCQEFLPPEQFTLRSDRPGHRKTRCRACCSAYQAARYLTIQKVDALNRARVTFMVDECSELVGIACADCGRPILADDLVHIDGRPRHEVCEGRS